MLSSPTPASNASRLMLKSNAGSPTGSSSRRRKPGTCVSANGSSSRWPASGPVDASSRLAVERIEEGLEARRDRLGRAAAGRQREQVLADPRGSEARRDEL